MAETGQSGGECFDPDTERTRTQSQLVGRNLSLAKTTGFVGHFDGRYNFRGPLSDRRKTRIEEVRGGTRSDVVQCGSAVHRDTVGKLLIFHRE